MSGAESGLDFARSWVTFPDPTETAELYRCDLTFLLSHWGCIYGRGCRGIDAGEPDAGCCTLGAHYTDRSDEQRVRRAAGELTPGNWQQHASARRGISTFDDGRRRTRTLNGACIFLNRPGFTGGAGCALHSLALSTGRHPLETKPEVCWQVPIRRSFSWEDRPDGQRVLVTTIAEYDRRAWGPGGIDLDWWCTSSREAHRERERVYRSCAAELTALMGEPAYRELAAICDRAVRGSAFAPHPAESRSARR